MELLARLEDGKVVMTYLSTFIRTKLVLCMDLENDWPAALAGTFVLRDEYRTAVAYPAFEELAIDIVAEFLWKS